MSEEEARLMHELAVSQVRGHRKLSFVAIFGCAGLLALCYFAGFVASTDPSPVVEVTDAGRGHFETWALFLGSLAGIGALAGILGVIRSTIWLLRNAR